MRDSSTSYVFDGNPLTRAQTLEQMLDEGTRRVLAMCGVTVGARCLEVGAGGGSIARWLAEQVGPDGQVVATDVVTTFLTEIPGPENLEVWSHDIVNDPLEERAFDLVHARLVLEHLPERDVALDKLVRSLRPGGWLVIEDVDYASGGPVSELGGEQYARTEAVRLREFAKAGVDHYYGRRLPGLLRAHGLVDVDNEGRAWVMSGGSPAARWFQHSYAHLRARLTSSGELTDADVDEMLELFGNPEWEALSPIFVAVWGRRPAA